jgi:hypothetical protein
VNDLPPCDMHADCDQPVAMLDQKGYVYCAVHGASRQTSQPCRKLRPHELNRLRRGELIERY